MRNPRSGEGLCPACQQDPTGTQVLGSRSPRRPPPGPRVGTGVRGGQDPESRRQLRWSPGSESRSRGAHTGPCLAPRLGGASTSPPSLALLLPSSPSRAGFPEQPGGAGLGRAGPGRAGAGRGGARRGSGWPSGSLRLWPRYDRQSVGPSAHPPSHGRAGPSASDPAAVAVAATSASGW